MALFHKRLFEIDPRTARLFAGTQMTAQEQKLLQAISAVIDALDDLTPLVPVLEDLGLRHAGWGVTDAHYDSVGDVLLWMPEQGLGEARTAEAAGAWAEAYGVVAAIMKSGAGKSGAGGAVREAA